MGFSPDGHTCVPSHLRICSMCRAMAQVVNPELQGLNVNVFRQSDIEESVANQMDAAIARQEAQQTKRRLQHDVNDQKQVFLLLFLLGML